MNPLNFSGNESEQFKAYKVICRANTSDWKSQTLKQILQEREEAWFANWVQQMIRIAKPGAPVIFENVMPPLCDYLYDWGGVSKDWWKKSIKTYGWDLDPESLEFGENLVWSQRYNVFIRKNGNMT